MDMLLLGSLLVIGGMLSLAGVFDGHGDNNDDDTNPDPVQHASTHGTAADDTPAAGDGYVAGCGGDDTITASGDAEAWGNAGDDTIAAVDTASAHGGAGDDVVGSIGGGTAYGGDGNGDLALSGGGTLWGNAGNDLLTLHNAYPGGSRVYGGAGDDTVNPSGIDTVYGDAGNDVLNGSISASNYGGEGDDHVSGGMDGSAYGGDGNDTVFGNSAHFGGAGNDVIEGIQGGNGCDGNDTIIGDDAEYVGYVYLHPYQGGAGDDQISTFSMQSVDAGAGNDIVTLERTFLNYDGAVNSSITLGDGHDTLALDPNAEMASYAQGNVYGTVTVTDFDTAQDQLAIILPQSSLSNLDITADTAGGFTDVTLHTLNGDPAQTFRLTGVTDLDPADIQFYPDHAAVVAGTPWHQGVTPTP